MDMDRSQCKLDRQWAVGTYCTCTDHSVSLNGNGPLEQWNIGRRGHWKSLYYKPTKLRGQLNKRIRYVEILTGLIHYAIPITCESAYTMG